MSARRVAALIVASPVIVVLVTAFFAMEIALCLFELPFKVVGYAVFGEWSQGRGFDEH